MHQQVFNAWVSTHVPTLLFARPHQLLPVVPEDVLPQGHGVGTQRPVAVIDMYDLV